MEKQSILDGCKSNTAQQKLQLHIKRVKDITKFAIHLAHMRHLVHVHVHVQYGTKKRGQTPKMLQIPIEMLENLVKSMKDARMSKRARAIQ